MSHPPSSLFRSNLSLSRQISWNFILLTAFILLLPTRGVAGGTPETVAWWRLNQEAGAANFLAQEGGYDLGFWSKEGFEPNYEGPPAPPSAMLRQGLESAGSALNVSESLQNAVGGISPNPELNLSMVSEGMAVEGFFNTMQHGHSQTILSAGEGRLDTSWSVLLSPLGGLVLSIFELENKDPSLSAEIVGDFCNGEWYFFTAWLMPPSNQTAGYLRLLAVGADGSMQSETVEWPESIVIREPQGNLQIGRSSKFHDPNVGGGLYMETFGGSLSDIRISLGIRKDADLLGKVPATR